MLTNILDVSARALCSAKTHSWGVFPLSLFSLCVHFACSFRSCRSVCGFVFVSVSVTALLPYADTGVYTYHSRRLAAYPTGLLQCNNK